MTSAATRKIAVTGGSGKLGRACIDALPEDGWTPFNFDLVPPRELRCSLHAAGPDRVRPGRTFIIAADDTVMSRPSADLMAEHLPDVEFRSAAEGTRALCSIEKARRLLGWTPGDHIGAL